MSFDRQRFLNLTVVDFSSNVGWNDEGSSLRIKIAPENQENIAGYSIGDIIDFQFGDFTYTGFLDKVIEKHDSGGVFYEATLSDGKEILRGVYCVVSNLYGVPSDDDCLVPNYLNIFRHFERNGYGSANANESGMDVKKFIQGVKELSAKCGIKSNGKSFSIDLGNLSEGLPDYYRIPGPTIPLMDVISQICEDTGKLWRVKLTGTTFTIQTISLAQDAANQKVYSTIASKARDKRVIAWEAGVEAATGVTSNFVLWGGAKESTIQFNKTSPTDAVISYFWGYDINGTALTSINYTPRTISNILGQSATFEVMDVSLPAIGIEDICGGNRYNTNTLELMCVMGSQEAWEFYLELGYPSGVDYSSVFLRGPRAWDYDRLYWTRYGGAASFPLKREFSEKEHDVGVRRAARLYAYLKSMCETYWGKQWLVQVNSGPSSNLQGLGNVLFENGSSRNGGLTVRDKLERKLPQDALTDPAKGTYNILPAQSGWLDPSVNLSRIPKEIVDGQFKDSQGKMQNWFAFQVDPSNTQIDDTSPDSYVSGSYVYIKATASENYVINGNAEAVHVSLPQTPLYLGPESGRSELGNKALSEFLFGALNIGNIGSSELFKVGFAPVTPWHVLLSFKAMTNDAYGPWYITSGGGGATKVEHVMDLTPWSVGSSANLEEVASKKFADINPISKFETGSLTVVSKPEFNLGEELSSNGAIVTSVNCTYGANGATVQYGFKTFTPKFGIPSRYIIERIKKQAIKQNEDRRNILKSYMDTIARQQAVYRAEMGSKIKAFFLDFLGRRHDRFTPHSLILMGNGYAGYAGRGGRWSRTKTLSAFMPYKEGPKSLATAKGFDFIDPQGRAASSLDTVFAPFKNAVGGSILPTLPQMLSGNLQNQFFSNMPSAGNNDPSGQRKGKVPTGLTYNPFKRFSSYDCLLDPGLDEYDNHNMPDFFNSTGSGGAQIVNVNTIALRGPLMISGWGIDLWTGFVAPIGPSTNYSGNIPSPWESADAKLTGPADLVWDSLRSVWTSHDVIRISPSSPIPQSIANRNNKLSSGGVSVYTDMYKESGQIEVFNISTKRQVTEGLAFYSVFDNRWYVDGDGCPIRFHDVQLLTSQLERAIQNSGGQEVKNPDNPDSALPFYADFSVEKEIVDPLIIKNNDGDDVPEHYRVDHVKTVGVNGFVPMYTGDYECPDGTVISLYYQLWFWHGLFKEVIEPDLENLCEEATSTTEDPNNTTPPPPSPPSPPSPPPPTPQQDYYLNQDPDTLCYYCSGNPSETNQGGPYDQASCEQYRREANAGQENCTTTTTLAPPTPPPTTLSPYYCMYLKSDPPPGCYVCQDCNNPPTENGWQRANPDNTYATANECIAAMPSAECPTTTTTQAPVVCYMYQDPDNSCYYCRGEDSENPLSPIGTAYSSCEECQGDADEKNTGDNTSCGEPVCLIEVDGCWTCVGCDSSPGGISSHGSYVGDDAADECSTAAQISNENSATCNTTSSTTSTTEDPNGTTTTTTQAPPPGCVNVLKNVTCGEDGQLVPEFTTVKACDQVVQSQSYSMQIQLLKAELKILSRKFFEVVDILEKHNIKVFK